MLGLISQNNGVRIADLFSSASVGAASTGQAWTLNSGTWVTDADGAYPSTDAAGNLASINVGTTNYRLKCFVKGDLNGADFRVPQLVVRRQDGANYLLIDLTNGACRLQKNDGGVFSTLESVATTTSDDTFYTLDIGCFDNLITVAVNGTNLIAHTLTGGNTKYSGPPYALVGLRLNKGGAPTSGARWSNLTIFAQ